MKLYRVILFCLSFIYFSRCDYIPDTVTTVEESIVLGDYDNLTVCAVSVCTDVYLRLVDDYGDGLFGEIYIDDDVIVANNTFIGKTNGQFGPICLYQGEHIIYGGPGPYMDDTSVEIVYSGTEVQALSPTYLSTFEIPANSTSRGMQSFSIVVDDLEITSPSTLIMNVNSGLQVNSISVIHYKMDSNSVMQFRIIASNIDFTLDKGDCLTFPYTYYHQLYNNVTIQCNVDGINTVLKTLILNSYEIYKDITPVITIQADDLGNTINLKHNELEKQITIDVTDLYCNGEISKESPGIIRDRRIDSTNDEYNNNMDCIFYLHNTYRLRSLKLNLADDSVDYIKVYKGNSLASSYTIYNNNSIIDETSWTGEMIVEFKSDDSNNGEGFILFYSGLLEDYGDSVMTFYLPSSTASTTITSIVNDLKSVLKGTYDMIDLVENDDYSIVINNTEIEGENIAIIITLFEESKNPNVNRTSSIAYVYESIKILYNSNSLERKHQSLTEIINATFVTYPHSGCNNGITDSTDTISDSCVCGQGFGGKYCDEKYTPVCEEACYTKSDTFTDCCIEVGDNVVVYSNNRLVHYNPNTFSYVALTESFVCKATTEDNSTTTTATINEEETSFTNEDENNKEKENNKDNELNCIELDENGYLESLPNGDIVTIYKNSLYEINGDTGVLVKKILTLPFDSTEYGVNRYTYDSIKDEWYILAVNKRSIYRLNNEGILLEPYYYQFDDDDTTNPDKYYSFSLSSRYVEYNRTQYDYTVKETYEYVYEPKYNNTNSENQCFIQRNTIINSQNSLESVGITNDTTPIMIIADSKSWSYMHPSFGTITIRENLEGYKEGYINEQGTIIVLDAWDKTCYTIFPNGLIQGTPRSNETFTHLDSGKPYSMSHNPLSNITYWSDNTGPHRITAMNEYGKLLGFLGLTFGDFGSAGSLTVRPSAYAPNCYLTEIITEGKAGDLITVRIHARNKVKEPWTYPTHFEIELKTTSNVGGVDVEYTFQGEVLPTNESDQYIGQFVVNLAQEYNVYVYHTVLKFMIDGIPYKYKSFPSYTDPTMSTASGNGLERGVAGEVMEFTVIACDRFGNIRDSGGDEIKVLIGGEEYDSLEIVDNLNGSYYITYNVTQAKSYVVEIFIKNDDEFIEIDKSPWTVLVTPREVDATHSEILQAGREEVTVDGYMTLQVILRDEYDNIITDDDYDFEVIVYADTISITNFTHTLSGDGTHLFQFYNLYAVDLSVRVRIDGYRIGENQEELITIPLKFKELLISRHDVLAVLMQALAVLSCIWVTVMLVALIKYRKHYIILMSQWELWIPTLIGAYFSNAGVIAYTTSISTSSCGGSRILVHFGFIMMLSAVFLKVWRYNCVVQSIGGSKRKKKITKESLLQRFLLVNCLSLFILILLQLVNPYGPNLIKGKNKLSGIVTIQDILYVCECRYDPVFRYMLLTAVLIFVCFILYYVSSISKIVQDNGFKDGTFIKYTMYNVLIFFTVGVIIESAMNSSPDIATAIYCLTMIIAGDSIPSLLIGFKFYQVYNYNKENGSKEVKTQFDNDEHLTMAEPNNQLFYSSTTNATTNMAGNPEMINFLDKLKVWQMRMFRKDLTQEQFEKLTRQLVRIVEIITGKASGLSRCSVTTLNTTTSQNSSIKGSTTNPKGKDKKASVAGRFRPSDARGSLNGNMTSPSIRGMEIIDPTISFSVLDQDDNFHLDDDDDDDSEYEDDIDIDGIIVSGGGHVGGKKKMPKISIQHLQTIEEDEKQLEDIPLAPDPKHEGAMALGDIEF